jgi:SPW repeat
MMAHPRKEAIMGNILQFERLQDWIKLGVGAALFVSPWLLQFTDLIDASRSAWITGLVIVILSASALLTLKPWEEWHDVAIGAWMLAAPVILGFTMVPEALGVHLILGAVLILAAGWEIWAVRHQKREN